MDYNKYMNIAIEEAKKGINEGGFPFGCCIVFNDMLTSSHNSCIQKNDPISHAEITAIKSACNKHHTTSLKGGTIFCTTEPCLMCLGAINWVNISTIVFGTSINDSREIGFKEINVDTQSIKKHFNYEITVIPNILYNECKNLFYMWENMNPLYKRIIKRGKCSHGVQQNNYRNL